MAYILHDNYGQEFQKRNRLMLVQVQNPTMSQDEIKIYLHLQKDQTDKTKLESVRKLKFLTILQPQQFMDEEQSYVLVYPEIMNFQVQDQNFNQLKRDKGYNIMLQLALTFDEFEKRNIDWPLESYNQLYFIDGIIYLSLIDYDFGKYYIQQKPKEIFYNFLQKYFLNDFPDIQQYMFKYDEKFEILDYLLQKNGDLHKINYLNPPYESTLKYLLGIEQLKSIYECGNSVVKSFPTPKKLDIVQYNLPGEVIYKSTKFQSSDSNGFIMQNINREIQLMELFQDSQQMAVCFLYLRIKQYSFLLQRKFEGTLADQQKTLQEAKDDELIKIVEGIGYKFALALKNMHSEKVIHRDLKPENLFVDSKDLLNTLVYIADFDRSKQLSEEKNMVLTTLATGNTAKYDPPEIEQTLQYDVFQYGLIMLTVANRYKYIGIEQGPRQLTTQYQYDQYYGKNAVIQHLSKYQYNPQFVDLIASCLSKNSIQRPTAEQIYNQMTKIYLTKKIRIICKNGGTNIPQQQIPQYTYQSQDPPQQYYQNDQTPKRNSYGKIKIISTSSTDQQAQSPLMGQNCYYQTPTQNNFVGQPIHNNQIYSNQFYNQQQQNQASSYPQNGQQFFGQYNNQINQVSSNQNGFNQNNNPQNFRNSQSFSSSDNNSESNSPQKPKIKILNSKSTNNCFTPQ